MSYSEEMDKLIRKVFDLGFSAGVNAGLCAANGEDTNIGDQGATDAFERLLGPDFVGRFGD